MEGNLLLAKTNSFHRVTFSRFALLTPPHTPLPGYHHQTAPKNVVTAKGLRRTFSKRVAIAGDFKTCDNSGPAGGRTDPPVKAGNWFCV
jgi:hypothetical protein